MTGRAHSGGGWQSFNGPLYVPRTKVCCPPRVLFHPTRAHPPRMYRKFWIARHERGLPIREKLSAIRKSKIGAPPSTAPHRIPESVMYSVVTLPRYHQNNWYAYRTSFMIRMAASSGNLTRKSFRSSQLAGLFFSIVVCFQKFPAPNKPGITRHDARGICAFIESLTRRNPYTESKASRGFASRSRQAFPRSRSGTPRNSHPKQPHHPRSLGRG